MTMTDHDRIREALSFVPADDRDLWLKMGMATKAELGDAGFGIWDAWSQQSTAYRNGDARDVWKSFHQDGGITGATLFYEAKQRGYQPKANGSHAMPDPEEVARRKRDAEARAAKEAEEREARRAKAATLAEHVLQSLLRRKPDGNPYLVRKQVAPVGTLRESTAEALHELL